jgi:site-specific DNA-methyltransferase (adenine-specific)
MHQSNTSVADMMRALRGFLGENDVMAYLTMMANHLLELYRVPKPTGSVYLHYDPTVDRKQVVAPSIARSTTRKRKASN